MRGDEKCVILYFVLLCNSLQWKWTLSGEDVVSLSKMKGNKCLIQRLSEINIALNHRPLIIQDHLLLLSLREWV
jgi:hypothetical protein